MAKRKISSGELAERVGITQAKPFDTQNQQGARHTLFNPGKALRGA